MKKLLATAVLVLAAHMSYAQDQLFTKYEEVKGVETVFISKALLSVAAGSKIGDLDIRKVAKKLEQVRILSVEPRWSRPSRPRHWPSISATSTRS